ncbi:DinB family protein [Roseivirga sp.]|uniref:DinB family protein n=1 Tax=Roseivirga sp. TaxID=1964215 RepID=UPI002B26FE88|nr:DinB family protein [Roseivirga sp.]
MKKDQIKGALTASYLNFVSNCDSLTKDEFEYAPEGKWSAGQQMEHLIKSTSPLHKGMGLPKFLIKLKFGKANRPSKTFDQLVERYKENLSLGGVASAAFTPQKVDFNQKEKLINQLQNNIESINQKLDKWAEAQLDEFIFPHPLLGKITIREMMYFTIHHADHHRNLIKIYLKGV